MSHPSPDEGSGRHPVMITHLVMGVAFLGVATVWLLHEAHVASREDLHWLLPIPWVAAGLVGLAVAALPRRRAHPDPGDDPELVPVPDHPISDGSATPTPDHEEQR